LFFAFAAFCCIFLAYGTYQGLVVAPTEETMGDVQRIFYVHVPAATVAFTLFFVNFLASVYYLWRHSAKADAVAATTAEVGVVFCSVVLITGPIWARYAWGVWWSPWDMRLNTTLMLWLLYVSYLMMRRSSSAGSTSVLAAALAVFSFLDVPIVYMANRWFRYEMERTAQKIDAAHIQRAAGGAAGMMLIPAMFLMAPGHVAPISYLWGGYLAAWGIYVAYLLFLMSKLTRLKKEAAELGA
jgi:hypothetical protein